MADVRNSNTRPVPPERPDNGDCCHSGCDPCVFDLYEEEMEQYRAALREWEKRNAEGNAQTSVHKPRRKAK